MTENEAWDLERCVTLIAAFSEGRLNGLEFQTLFLALYKLDPTHWSPEGYEILQEVFYAVEDYDETSDGEVELRAKLAPVLERMPRLGGSHH